MSDGNRRAEMVLDLFDDYYERVYCFVRRSLPAEQAEDVVQEVFIRLLEHKRLERMTLSVSYLIKIADNLLKRRFARQQRFGRYLEETGQRQESVRDAVRAGPMPALDAHELDRAMGDLTGDERDAVQLIVCQGLSYEDAARSLGVTVSTINNWKYRGLQKLKHNALADARRPSGELRPAQPIHGRGDREQTAGARAASRSARPGDEIDGPRRMHRRVCSI